MIDKMSIGKIIKNLRVNKNLTQEELSEKIDISKNYLSKVERGISLLNVESFLKMAEVLEFSLEDFGVKTSNKTDKTKNELLNRILAMSDKEIIAYTALLNNFEAVIKILK